jgi:1,4-alpha-glucan branching enzyme
MKKGFLSIILHAHLPFVHHPEQPSPFEERWLFEAITDCYIPLIRMFDRLLAAGTRYKLVLSLSPTLIAMLDNELLRERCLNHIKQMLALADKEMERTRVHAPAYHNLACMYQRLLSDNLYVYETCYQTNLLNAFIKHLEAGHVELITSAATHGFLPLLNQHESAVRAQLFAGVQAFEQALDIHPSGIWLPECGYYPGLERLLKKAGLHYFFADSHGILHASESPRLGVHAPLDCGNGVAAFGRDPDCSRRVWSATEGYPGDFDYREYYSDIGFELDLDYIRPHVLEGGIRVNTGIKYHKVTGGDRPKEIYNPVAAANKANEHAFDFLTQRRKQIEHLTPHMEKPPIIVAPYDAELFGHWWFEGPLWLESFIRQADMQDNNFELIGCTDYLVDHAQPMQKATPSESSWGENGYHRYWLNDKNDWIYPHLHQACRHMEDLANDYRNIPSDSLMDRALKQAARSLLLAQASDWPFIMKSGTTVEYAAKRVTDHLARFNYLYDSITNNRIDHHQLSALEIMDDIFPDIDYHYYCTAD